MKKIYVVILTLFTFLSANILAVETDSNKRETIKKMIYSMGTKESAEAIINQMVGMYIGMFPDVPAQTWDEIRKEIDVEELVEIMIPIYDKYFTESEINDIAAFYESPTGKKLALATPAMTRESMKAGEEWGLKIAGRIMDKLSGKTNRKKDGGM